MDLDVELVFTTTEMSIPRLSWENMTIINCNHLQRSQLILLINLD